MGNNEEDYSQQPRRTKDSTARANQEKKLMFNNMKYNKRVKKMNHNAMSDVSARYDRCQPNKIDYKCFGAMLCQSLPMAIRRCMLGFIRSRLYSAQFYVL